MTGPLDLKLVHPRTESAWIESQDFCCSIVSFDSPASTLESSDDILPLHFFQAPGRRKRLLLSDLFKAIDQLKHAALAVDHCALYDVR